MCKICIYHSFVDGNKRIAVILFLWFIQNSDILYNLDGTKRISDGILVVLLLMINESCIDEKRYDLESDC